MSDFDSKAATWDLNDMHRERSEAIADEIRKIIPLSREMKALEYGAGTGMASFLLKDDVKEITLMDNSAEMVKVMRKKIRSSGTTNLHVMNFDLETREYKKGRFDLVFTNMVLHHVTDLDIILKRFAAIMNPGGYLAIADLYAEDGSFHGEGFTGHNGFDVDKLTRKLMGFGFTNITHRTCFEIDRMVSETESRKFPVFLLTGIMSKKK